ncbi:hypothetical protein Droror1_Dr00027157 [Drosera rotundifolia]
MPTISRSPSMLSKFHLVYTTSTLKRRHSPVASTAKTSAPKWPPGTLAQTLIMTQVVGVEIVHGTEECRRRSLELLEELGFPKEVLPLKDLEEYGRVHSTGFVWMKQKAATEHYFEKAKSLVRYAEEVTGYVEKGRVKRVVGVKSKQAMLWVPVTEMSIGEDPVMPKICFTTLFGVRKTFPITAFTIDEEPAMTEFELVYRM